MATLYSTRLKSRIVICVKYNNARRLCAPPLWARRWQPRSHLGSRGHTSAVCVTSVQSGADPLRYAAKKACEKKRSAKPEAKAAKKAYDAERNAARKAYELGANALRSDKEQAKL